VKKAKKVTKVKKETEATVFKDDSKTQAFIMATNRLSRYRLCIN